MSERDPPKLESFAELLARGESKKTLASNYTRISFIPDFKRFGEKGLSEDTVALMKRRVFDVAACVNTNIQMAKQTKKSRGDDATGEKTKKIKIFLNGVQVEVDSFPKYLDLFPSASQVSRDGSSLEAADGKWVFSNVNEKWQIAVGPNVSIGSIESKKADSVEGRVTSLPPATRDISFVNSIYTSRGGTHVNHVADRITRAIVEHILKQHKTITKDMLPAGLIKQHMSILVNCKIPNPSFSSQTKESLMTPVADFKSECTLSQSFLASILAPSTGIVPAIVDSVVSRQQIDLLRKSRANANKRGKLLNIPKLDDAHWAGSSDPKKVKQTTLILTEGDSAKALVLSSLSILGRDRYGVFPLKGKLLNVRDASLKQVMENAEIQNILAIVGLEIGAKYHLAGGGGAADGSTSPARAPSKPLRYGRIMLMTDQDHDGSHIKGLFLNLLHTYWPDLLKSSNFLEEFVTAIIKVRVNGAAGKTKDNSTLSFQTQIEFEQWKSQLPPDVLLHPEKFKRLYTVKYYKGLGTNTNEEGKEYFRNMDKHRVKFVWQMGLNGGNSGAPTMKDSSVQSKKREVASTLSGPSLLPPPSSSASDWIRLAFSKDQADARKEWLQTRWHEKLFVDTSRKELAIEDFINKELIVFSHADNIRSIPSLLDGLKPVQRKILYGCFKKKLQSEIKVAQLSGYISEQTMYHHGEVSLQGTIVNMAQSFIGSNNLALLVGAGQFGSRNTGGKDAAAARYIFTSLSPITRVLFHPHDDPLLTYKDEDGFLVEPEFYLPVLPVVLVNGAEGIGTGFSTAVPTYNPLHLIENLRLWLNDRPLKQLHPWTRGWKGVLKPSAQVDGEIVSYQSEGIIQQVSPTSLEVRELPLGRWPEEFKSHLASLQSASEIKRFKDECTDERILYRVEVTHEQAKDIERVGVMKFFKLTSSLSLNNMHLFNGHNLIRKYRSAVEVLKEFAGVRLEYYRRRREHLLIALQVDLQRVQNKKRFISLVTSSGMVVYNRKKQDLIQELVQLKFETAQELLPRFPIYANHEAKTPIKWTNTVDPAKVVGKLLDTDSFDYLLQMPLSTLTAERLEALQSEYDSALAQVGTLTKADAKSLWLHDLQKLEEQLLKGNAKSAAAARTIDAEVIEQE
jgi:DNA topoisomerase-2